MRAVTSMTTEEKVGPQSANSGDTNHYQTTTATSEYSADGKQSVNAGPAADALPPRRWPTIFDGVDRRLFDAHIAFDGRWSTDQLTPIVEQFELPTTKAAERKASYATANLARSLVLDGRGGMHYSRSRKWYADRYKGNGDPFHSFEYTTTAADWLAENGYAEHILGHHVPNRPGAGWQSTLYPTQKLIDTIGDLVDPLEPRAIAPRPEVMILKDDQGNLAPYINTPQIKSERAEIWTFNDHFADRELHRNGQLVEIPIFRRVFNRTFDRGGRLYCAGNSYQQLPGKQRLEITEVIDGATVPFVEIDFEAHHIRGAYALAGKQMPEGDPYAIGGFDRDLIKAAGLIPLNARDRRSAIGAVAHETGADRKDAKAAITAFRARHPGIKDYFWSDAGARLMRLDSDMTVAIMKRVLAATGRCPLPQHDSYLVPLCDQPAVSRAMAEVSAEFSVKSSLKLSLPELGGCGQGLAPTTVTDEEREPPTPPPYPSMGNVFSPLPLACAYATPQDPSVLDRYRQKTSPKKASREDYESWLAANLGHDPRPPIENPEKHLAWCYRNSAFLWENGRYTPRHKFDTGATDYASWFAHDRQAAQLVLEGMDPAKTSDIGAVVAHWKAQSEAAEAQKAANRCAGAAKAAQTRRKRKELGEQIPVRRTTIAALLGQESR